MWLCLTRRASWSCSLTPIAAETEAREVVADSRGALPAGLTAGHLEVLGLLGEGPTNHLRAEV